MEKLEGNRMSLLAMKSNEAIGFEGKPVCYNA